MTSDEWVNSKVNTTNKDFLGLLWVIDLWLTNPIPEIHTLFFALWPLVCGSEILVTSVIMLQLNLIIVHTSKLVCHMYLSAILGIALYRKFWYKSLHTINFDNPVYRKTTEENVNLERDPSSVSMTSSVTMSTSVSANGAKRSYTSNTLATDVSEVSMAYTILLRIILEISAQASMWACKMEFWAWTPAQTNLTISF